MENIIQVENRFYVLATSSLADGRTRVLKYGQTFAVFDLLGDIQAVGLREQGLYHHGTRYLSRLSLRLEGDSPQLLRSTIQDDGSLFTVDIMNPDVYRDGRLQIPRGTLHVFRSKFLWENVCYERIRLSNFALVPVETSLSLRFGADYHDVFEVRGMERPAAGQMQAPEVGEDCVVLSYVGRDHEVRRTRLDFTPAPSELTADTATYAVALQPREEMEFVVRIDCEHDRERPAHDFDEAMEESTRERERSRQRFCTVVSPNQGFCEWLSRSQADVLMMVRGNPEGAYPYAGVPWYSTVFGRDALITALECLWAAPWIARSVLQYLAQHQAVEVIPAKEAEPGKILHEMRQGEMASLNEIPFGLYYGSVDATPLFTMLAGAYFEQTGDVAFLETIWPNILAAMDWIDHYGDVDGDGFVEYQAKAGRGLVNQGWKDSHDAVFHADGSIATPPIALCEVQAYVYGARRAAAKMAASMGQDELGARFSRQAHELQQKFERDFWDEELGSYRLALDDGKKPCRVLASNAGHALWTGIASAEHAERLVRTLLGDRLFSGWGVRTVGSNEARYNPMAYHNGSMWPHDNAIIAAGFARYGHKREAASLAAALLDASRFMELNRLPELLCGFHKRPGVEGPTLYPVACSPQAWSAGAAYMFLGACLGIQIDDRKRTVRLTSPVLPEVVDRIMLRGVPVGGSTVDLDVHAVGGRTSVDVRRNDSNARVEVNL